MVLDMHNHSANQGPFRTIEGGAPSIDGNAALMVQRDDRSLQCGP